MNNVSNPPHLTTSGHTTACCHSASRVRTTTRCHPERSEDLLFLFQSRKRQLPGFAQLSVKLIRDFEFLLEFLARQIRAYVINRLRQPIERMRNIFFIRKHDVAPQPVRATRDPQQIFQPGPCKRKRQPSLIVFILHHARKRNRNKLRQVRDDSHGPVMRFRIAPNRLRANRANKISANPRTRSSESVSAPMSAYGAPRNKSASARSIPGCSFPAMGCPPQEARTGREFRVCRAADHILRAARVGDESFCVPACAAISESASMVAPTGSAT